jgi:hypothetical protein
MLLVKISLFNFVFEMFNTPQFLTKTDTNFFSLPPLQKTDHKLITKFFNTSCINTKIKLLRAESFKEFFYLLHKGTQK